MLGDWMLPRPPLAATFALAVAIGVAAALVFGRSKWRRYLSWALAAAASLVTWLAPPDLPIARFLLALIGALVVFHVLDLSRDRRDLSAGQRVWFVLTPFDTRAARRTRPAVRAPLVLAIVIWSAVSATAFWLLIAHTPADGPPRFFWRWVLGPVAFYSLVEVVVATVYQGYLLGGIEPPTLHDNPALARTVQQFWGERWNLEVRRLLYVHAFLPLARRGRPATGLFAAFLVSALLHVWLMWPSAGVAMAGLWAIYFSLQAVIVVLERRLGVTGWPRPAAHAWTIALLLLPSPLFVEPMLRVLPG